MSSDTQEKINAHDIAYIKDAVKRIEEQVKYTNGRVSSLEKWKYGLACSVGTLAAMKWPIIGELLSIVGQ